MQTPLEPNHISSTSELATPPISGLFNPIEISPAVFPHYPYPSESLPPMYPTFPTTYEPNLTGKCPVNFSAMSNLMDKTASDCSVPLAALVGNVICCPQLGSLLHIFQGYYSINSDKLVLENSVANDCFSDIISILASRGANTTIPALCSVKSSNLTGGSCPVKDVISFEKIVNTSKLLEACSAVDPLKECCRPICQPAVMEAVLHISGTQLTSMTIKNYLPIEFHAAIRGCLYSEACLQMFVFDNSTGFSFTCDLIDNIAAPWPISSSMSSLSLCAPEMSLPALPTSETLKNPGGACCPTFCSFLLLSA
ncbi:hypothetical protein GH714_005247 [Hevea brasiliensis]|uniref:SPARK domain-containing protein n=1 Tax=Hevea brasiliensis TaxID=3981 RepID=A0A6A6N724_HEVBR|nr:hypothetical protein GH714_005247 [Hevea brasiliensis]